VRLPTEPFPVRFIRGDAKGAGPTALRLALTPFSWIFGTAVEVRHSLYRSGVFTVHRVPCPVVSVGNLTLGGTGKTPLVEWIVREARMLGKQAVVLSRGYGASANGIPDELAALAASLDQLAFVSDPDRVRGALEAIERHRADVLVLDDGFQHYRLARDLDVVAVDATLPFGDGYCLPRGMLREPIRALRRAGVLVVTRADQVPPEALERLARRLHRAAPRAVLATAAHRPHAVRSLATGEVSSPGLLAGARVFAASGIGNPRAFEETLKSLGAELVGAVRFIDHHDYQPAEIDDLRNAASAAGAEFLVTTQKDAVKWPSPTGPGPEPVALEVRIAFRTGVDAVREALRRALQGA